MSIVSKYYKKNVDQTIKRRWPTEKVEGRSAHARFFTRPVSAPQSGAKTLCESDAANAYEPVWSETLSWLSRRETELADLPRTAPSRLQLDSLRGIFEKAKVDPEADPATVRSTIEAAVAELNAIAAEEEPGEIADFLNRTNEAMRDLLYRIGEETPSFDDPAAGGGLGGGGLGMGDEEGGGLGNDEGEEGADGGAPDAGADAGEENEDELPENPALGNDVRSLAKDLDV